MSFGRTDLCALLLLAAGQAAAGAAPVWPEATLPVLREMLTDGVIDGFKAEHPDTEYNIEVGIQSEGDCSKVVLNDVEAAADVYTFADDQFNSLYNAGALQQVMEGVDEIAANNAPAIKEQWQDMLVG